MKKSSVESIIMEISEDIAKELDLEIFDVEYVKEGTDMYLKIYIDKAEGVNIDDCQLFTQKINPILDEKDPISEFYFLEVSSPGLDRPFKRDSDYESSIGEDVELSLYAPIDGTKAFTAKLIEYDGNIVKVEDENSNIIEIEKKAIAKINKAIKF